MMRVYFKTIDLIQEQYWRKRKEGKDRKALDDLEDYNNLNQVLAPLNGGVLKAP